jgi:putative transposon-encoded protein
MGHRKTDFKKKKKKKFMNFTNGELSFARILVTFGNSFKVDLKQNLLL